MTWTKESAAKIGITVQFLALVRTLSEYFRLKHFAGAGFDFARAEPFVVGALIAAIFCWVSVTLFFFKHYLPAVVVSALTVVVLLAYKIYALP